MFSTIQSLNNSLHEFSREEFEYIIIDEAHHSTSPSYKRVIEYFKPKFLLGMTATPERSDGDGIFDLFNNNIALEVRLGEALNLDLVIPFHYFGITDVETIDLSDVNLKDIEEVAKRLQVNQRVDLIVEKMNFYGYDGEKPITVLMELENEIPSSLYVEFNKKV